MLSPFVHTISTGPPKQPAGTEGRHFAKLTAERDGGPKSVKESVCMATFIIGLVILFGGAALYGKIGRSHV